MQQNNKVQISTKKKLDRLAVSVVFVLMDKFLVPSKPSTESPKPKPRCRPWQRSILELNGKFDPKYRHDLSGLLMHSYSEIGAFPHFYHIDGKPCQTHINRINNAVNSGGQLPFRMQGISAVDFDNKGIYLVSVTKSGCLTVHDFETLYCQSNDSLPRLTEDESKHLLHLYLRQQLDVVRWNLANQDEVACTSVKSNEVLIFDIGYISSKPVEVLRTRRSLSVLGSEVYKGLCDIAFTATDDSRLIASDTHGIVNIWDRRKSVLPCLELITGSCSTLNTIQPHVENQTIFGASKDGNIYMWDLRGGRTAAAFQCHNEAGHPPLISLKLATMLEKIGSLKAQSDIVPKEIHSIDLDPSCPYQLAFHLDDGWSGVLDIYNLRVTHVHCPPPAWLNGASISADLLYLRKPSWLPTSSIYAVGSSSDSGIHILDFYPDTSSPSHVDYKEDLQSLSKMNYQRKQNIFVPLSEGVTTCASHPLNGTIVAGTKHSSLLVVSQPRQSF
ncbi:Transducin/WD40 repeat-like superfamily protein isoform 1 [Theobroma cacao]|uniref:Transducin/WD40 repeat-like superfamily protein isoform 1 n=1 Tax=Theobroma cacao TaxID=3641 RepID=A0A061GT14_THECC|nr:Transducin/WD40 repeat-like superfamily protein isoform 1 [Theobroma cacao]